jgi:putative FmdB family regulatory protein
MPIYEYRCTSCGKVFARLQSVSAATVAPSCPKCGSSDTERLLSTFAAGSSSTAGTPGGGAPTCGAGGGG